MGTVDLSSLEAVDVVDVMGMKHYLFDEGIFAFVRPKKGQTLTADTVLAHCKTIAAYKRPLHVEIWPNDEEFPLTRSTKVDKIRLMEKAETIIENLRKEGKWDAGQTQ